MSGSWLARPPAGELLGRDAARRLLETSFRHEPPVVRGPLGRRLRGVVIGALAIGGPAWLALYVWDWPGAAPALDRLDRWTAAYAAAVIFLAYLVRGIGSFGSGLVAVPLLSFVLPVQMVVPLVVALDYFGSASQGIRNVHCVAWREQLVLVPFMLVGAGSGLYLLTALPAVVLTRTLGAFVIGFALYHVLPVPAMRGSRAFAPVCGLLGGLVGTLFGTGGPFYVIYFHLRAMDRSVFRATFAVNFLIDGSVRLTAYVIAGFIGSLTVPLLVAALPVAAAGLYLGGRIQAQLTQVTFARVVGVLLAVTGVALLLAR